MAITQRSNYIAYPFNIFVMINDQYLLVKYRFSTFRLSPHGNPNVQSGTHRQTRTFYSAYIWNSDFLRPQSEHLRLNKCIN